MLFDFLIPLALVGYSLLALCASLGTGLLYFWLTAELD